MLVAGSVREVERLEDAVSRAEAGRLSAEASLAHSSALQQGEVRSAQQALQAATKDLQDCQARLADLETTNAMLIQEQQVYIGSRTWYIQCYRITDSQTVALNQSVTNVAIVRKCFVGFG